MQELQNERARLNGEQKQISQEIRDLISAPKTEGANCLNQAKSEIEQLQAQEKESMGSLNVCQDQITKLGNELKQTKNERGRLEGKLCEIELKVAR